MAFVQSVIELQIHGKANACAVLHTAVEPPRLLSVFHKLN